jgi:hypothetical protein
VALATPGTTAHYVGNWTLSTSGTSSSEPVTIQPAPGITNLTLDGNDGNATGCQTSACDESVLTVESGVYASLAGVTVQGANADNVAAEYCDGGAIANYGALTATASTFSANTANGGGGTRTTTGASHVCSGRWLITADRPRRSSSGRQPQAAGSPLGSRPELGQGPEDRSKAHQCPFRDTQAETSLEL